MCIKQHTHTHTHIYIYIYTRWNDRQGSQQTGKGEQWIWQTIYFDSVSVFNGVSIFVGYLMPKQPMSINSCDII